MTAEALVEAARGLAPTINACREEIERERRLPPALVEQLIDAGLFRMLTPARFGGLEVEPLTALRVFEELACADGSTGWCVMIGNSGIFAAWLPERAAEEIYGSNPRVITGGALAPTGRAVEVEGGYRATGRWAFGSGCRHSDWLVGNCVVFEGEAPRLREGGVPETRVLVFPASDFEIIDTWSVAGLRGTGSHDFAVSDVFVPAERCLAFSDTPLVQGPLYRMPIFGLLGAVVASVPLGIARGAIDTLVDLASSKMPRLSSRPLREHPLIQTQVAQAEGLLRMARALLHETVGEAWQRVSSGGEVPARQRALLRLAATQAARSAAEAVDLMYHAAGSTSIYTSSPLERRFRDVHVAIQHALVQPVGWEVAGRVLLGLEPDTPVF
jgi:alkylation response protein AidB-like acyl-CoA dehydrogenase